MSPVEPGMMLFTKILHPSSNPYPSIKYKDFLLKMFVHPIQEYDKWMQDIDKIQPKVCKP